MPKERDCGRLHIRPSVGSCDLFQRVELRKNSQPPDDAQTSKLRVPWRLALLPQHASGVQGTSRMTFAAAWPILELDRSRTCRGHSQRRVLAQKLSMPSRSLQQWRVSTMSTWLYNLPIGWMALVVFGFTFLVAAAIQATVRILAVGEWARSFKAVSPSMLPPLGAIFALFIAFTAVQVWSDNDRASVAVSREASALRAVVFLASIFPAEPEARLRGLIHRYIEEVAIQEWPIMAHHAATLRIAPRPLVEALQLTLALPSSTQGQGIAQREIAVALENALDARRQRIIVSEARVVSSSGGACSCRRSFGASFQQIAERNLPP